MSLALTGAAPSARLPALRPLLARFGLPLLGIGAALAIWAALGALLARNPAFTAFTGLAPAPALAALWQMLATGDALNAALPSLERLFGGLASAVLLGAPRDFRMGLSPAFERAAAAPCQCLRMLTPHAWMQGGVLGCPG